MKVYLLLWFHGTVTDVLGVYAEKMKAHVAAVEYGKKHKYEGSYEVRAMEVIN